MILYHIILSQIMSYYTYQIVLFYCLLYNYNYIIKILIANKEASMPSHDWNLFFNQIHNFRSMAQWYAMMVMPCTGTAKPWHNFKKASSPEGWRLTSQQYLRRTGWDGTGQLGPSVSHIRIFIHRMLQVMSSFSASENSRQLPRACNSYKTRNRNKPDMIATTTLMNGKKITRSDVLHRCWPPSSSFTSSTATSIS